MNNLIFSRQFILSKGEIAIDSSWKTKKLGKIKTDFYLSAHPDLDLIQYNNNAFELVLLGYALNPFQPDQSSLDILKDLSLQKDFVQIVEAANILSGRFLIIYNDAGSVKMFHDATGFREVYYINTKDIIACGSTPNILTNYFRIPEDEDKQIKDFFNSAELKSRSNIWIGTRTIYKNLMYLLPNHYLDLIENKAIRFWPVKEKKALKIDDAADYMSKILTGTYAAAVKRFKLHQGLTSGWDTRLLLAASKEYIKDIHFFFIRGFKTDATNKLSMDYQVATQMSEKYGFPIEIIELDENLVDNEFKQIYFQNNVLARPNLLPVYYDLFQKKLGDTVTVSGSGSNEILRLASNIHRKIDDSYSLAKSFGYQNYKYVLESLDEWLHEIRPLIKANYIPMDMFWWEQMFAHWGGLSGSEQNIVREELRAFNNRELISTYISLQDRYRHRDYPLGHVKMIKLLWNDLLNFKMDIPKYRLKKVLRFFGLERVTDRVYQRLKGL